MPTPRLWGLVGCLLGWSAAGAAACGGDGAADDDRPKVVSGRTLTIYSSLPLRGPTRRSADALNRGAKLALKQSGHRLGRYRIRFRTLDDSTADTGRWDPAATQRSARRAVEDPTTIAYLGEFDSGATANSLPILNKAGILQVSPTNTAVGLTTDEPGAAKGEPDRFYPTTKRTYGRIVPRDAVQGAVLAKAMEQDRCRKVFIVDDEQVYGQGLARIAEERLNKTGIDVVDNEDYDANASDYRSLASSIRRTGADCILGAVLLESNAAQLFGDLAAGVPKATLYGPDALAETRFTDRAEGGIPAKAAERVKVAVAVLDPSAYPARGQRFFADYRRTFGENPQPYAIYGYEAMSVILDALRRAGARANHRQAVIDEFFATRQRTGVLGTYDIDENGDTSLTDYGLYTVADGRLRFQRTIRVAP
jgi:branched-chain amino acid transport system substrate-binding protein